MSTSSRFLTVDDAADYIDTHIAFLEDERQGVRRGHRLGAFKRGWAKGASQPDGDRSLQSLTWHNLGNRFHRFIRSKGEQGQHAVEQAFDAFWRDFEMRGSRPPSSTKAHLRAIYHRSAITAALADPALSTKPSKTYYVVSPDGRQVDMRSLGTHIDERWGRMHTNLIAECLMDQGFVVRCPTRLSSYEKAFGRFIENGHLCFDDEEAAEPAAERRRSVLRTVTERPGQGRFRRALLQVYGGKCAMSGVDHELVLQAAHIQSVARGGSDALRNGLLLRADLHLLFDAARIAVDESNWTILIHPTIERLSYVADLAGQKLRLPRRRADRPDPALLREHRRVAGL